VAKTPQTHVPEVERDLQKLETGLKNLEAQYNMFFAGRLPKPPWDTRSAVEALVKRYDRGFIQNYADRFRFQTLQSRWATLIELWDKGIRSREEGRPGPFAHPPRPAPDQPKQVQNRILGVTAFSNVVREQDKLHELYESLAEARHEVGLDPVPFHKFAELVKNQVKKLGDDGTEVAFRVAIKEGKVSFTARAMKGSD
jgi:hypothetical protein